AGAIAASGANIVDARIFTTTDGVAVDSFRVQEGPYDSPGAAFADPDRLALLEATVGRSVADEIDPGDLLRGRRTLPVRAGVFQVAPRVLIDDRASATHTVIEVNGRDRPGLLYDLTRALADEKLQISSAKISTYGERVVDVFYVKDAFGLKVTHPAKLEQVRTALLAALAEPAQGAEETAAVRPLVAATP
ncbi:MAG: ACT domain-containing protein, partial [Alphaproteobacteria bacterium]